MIQIDEITQKGIILIVDDTPANLGVLFDFLADSGFKVLVAQDGESALQKVEYAAPDLILLDVRMPGIDGFETCRRLKANDSTKDIPVIFMTALSETVDKIRGLNLGAVDYITKPFQHEEVLARVSLHLSLRNLTKQLREQNVHLHQEIQERISAEHALRQSEERFRTIVDTAQEGIWLLDAQAHTCYINQRMSEMLGYDVGEILDRTLFDFIEEVDRPEAVQKFEQCLQGFSKQHDFRFLRKDGKKLWTIISTSSMIGDNGEVIGTLSMLTDITGRKHSEQKIFEQAALLDITTDAILVRDLENKVLFWNKGAERLYGWKAEEAIGKNIKELLYKENFPEFLTVEALLSQKSEWQGELNQVTKEGKAIIVASRWTLVHDQANKPKSILVVNTDITEKKQFETQFLRAQRLESLGTLAGGIAHDLNNVLAPILMAVQLLEMKIEDERSRQWLSIVELNVKRGADLVKQVLSFARGYEGKHTHLDIKHLLLEIEQIVKETFPKSIEVQTNLSPGLRSVYGDTTQLHQVLLNLCVNARDAMAEGGILSLSAEHLFIDENYALMNIEAQVGPYVVITVSDTGTGIPPEILERIFEPFFTTKELGQGTGLGLSTVVGLIKGHGGFVDVHSKIRKGTQFKVYLPATGDSFTEQPEEKKPHEIPLGHGEVILVVDDEESIREITKTSLEIHDYKVLSASDGVEAVALYAQHKEEIKVVLIDMMMPLMDGSIAIRILQKMNPEVKIIAVSGRVPNHKMTELFGKSVKMFMPKPYTSEELLQNLYVVLNMD